MVPFSFLCQWRRGRETLLAPASRSRGNPDLEGACYFNADSDGCSCEKRRRKDDAELLAWTKVLKWKFGARGMSDE